MKLARSFPLAVLSLLALSVPHVLAFPQSTPTEPPSDVPALLQKLIASDEVERRVLMEQFDQINDPDVLVPPVLAALATVDPQESWKLLDVLARFSSYAKPEPLIGLARRSDRIPSTLTLQLISIGTPVRAALLNAIADACVNWQPVPEDTASLDSDENSDDKEKKEQAAKTQRFLDWAATTLGQASPQGLDAVLKMLRDRDACHRTTAANGLIAYALAYGPALKARLVPSVAAALSDHDPLVQKAAATVLEPVIGFHLAPLTPQMTAALFAILKTHPDAAARTSAFQILRNSSPTTAKKAVAIALHDSDDRLRNFAEQVLDEQSNAIQDQPQP